MAFDPDQYLQDKEASFNPDTYLADKEEKPGFFKRMGNAMLKDAPEIAGSVAGGMAALPVAAAVGLPTGGAGFAAVESAASGVGSMLGGVGKQLYQQATGSPDAPQTSEDALKEMGSDFATGAAGSIIGSGVSAAAEGIAKPITEALTPSVKAGTKILRDAFAKVGGTFSPAQTTENAMVDALEEFVESSWTGMGKFKVFREGQKEAVTKLASKVSDMFDNALKGASDEEVGTATLGALTRGEVAHQVASNKLYQNVDNLLSEGVKNATGMSQETAGKVSTLNFKRLVQDASDELKIIKSPIVSSLVRTVKAIPDDISFSEAHAARSQLIAKLRDLGEGQIKDSMGAGYLKKAVSTLDDSMERAASDLSGNVKDAWRAANAFYKDGKQTFYDDFIMKLSNKYPEQIGESVAATGNVTPIKILKNALNKSEQLTGEQGMGSETIKAIQAGHWDKMLSKITTPDGSIDGTAGLKMFQDVRQKRMMEELYSPEQLSTMKQFFEVAQKIHKPTGAGGSIAAKVSQIGAIGGIGSGLISLLPVGEDHKSELRIGSMALLLGPYGMAKLMTNPTGIKLLTEGLKVGVGRGTEQAASIASKLAAFTIKNGMATLQGMDNEKKTK